MKVRDLNLLESLNSGYPVTEVPAGLNIRRFEFAVPNRARMAAIVLKKRDPRLAVYSLIFINDSAKPSDRMNAPGDLTTSESLAVLGTIFGVIRDYLQDMDLLLALPEDDDPAMESKKLTVYSGLASRLVSRGIARSWRTIDIYGRQVIAIMNRDLNDSQIERVCSDFILDKTRPSGA